MGVATVECKCNCCQKPFIARVADRKRGWARFCSKSCKAKSQSFPQVKTVAKASAAKKPPAWIKGVFAGQLFRPNLRDQYEMHDAAMDDVEAGWDGQK